MPREKLELIIDNRDFKMIKYFSRDFQFLDLRKMNKDYKSANETIPQKCKRRAMLHDSYMVLGTL